MIKNMSPNGGGEPEGELLAAINRDFGSFDQFKAKMSAATVAVQGSGWGWLGFNKEANRLQIATCANQDPLQVIFYTMLDDLIQIYSRLPLDLFQSLVLMFGNMPTTFNIRMSDQITLINFGMLLTGKMPLTASVPPNKMLYSYLLPRSIWLL